MTEPMRIASWRHDHATGRLVLLGLATDPADNTDPPVYASITIEDLETAGRDTIRDWAIRKLHPAFIPEIPDPVPPRRTPA